MKKLIAVMLSLSLFAPSANAVMQYQPPQPGQAASGGSSRNNTVPIVLIVGAVVTAGVILFKANKKRAAFRNPVVMARGYRLNELPK